MFVFAKHCVADILDLFLFIHRVILDPCSVLLSTSTLTAPFFLSQACIEAQGWDGQGAWVQQENAE